MTREYKKNLPLTRGYLDDKHLQVIELLAAPALLVQLKSWVDEGLIKGFIADLAQLELASSRVLSATEPPQSVDTVQVNPTLEIVEVSWRGLVALCRGEEVEPQPEPQKIGIWRHPITTELQRQPLDNRDLLALKIVVDQHDPVQLADHYQRPVGTLDYALQRAIQRGILQTPPSKISRYDTPMLDQYAEIHQRAEVFTLQWHITHRCDLHCKHCYDRSERHDVLVDQGVELLDQMREFCLNNNVSGQVSFSGGNPVMHPNFLDLYRAATERNLNVAILGNAVSDEVLEQMITVAKPAFYQVSLEGLAAHNDLIRGRGNFATVLDFLARLKKRKMFSMVMLTLTRENLDQVLPLAELLRDKVDLFCYNRLAMVGEGANLLTPQADEYQQFVQDYLDARENNPIMGLKDGLMNIERQQRPEGIFGGCTGFGCGAAFNFVSVLPDGQVHACRKFPSAIGDLNQQTLAQVYESSAARSYRRGCLECDPCQLRPVCGGCLAAAYGCGVDPLVQKDPACFIEPAGMLLSQSIAAAECNEHRQE